MRAGVYGGVRTTVVTADFLTWNPGRTFEAVIGNPPYVRFQDLGEVGRARAKAAGAVAGVELSALASLWAAFVVKAGESLGDEGRMALVLPGELLSAGYAGAVREYVLGRFSEVNLVLIGSQVFGGAGVESVLLMASGRGGSTSIRVSRVEGAYELASLDVARGERILVSGRERWSEALVEGAGVVESVGRALGAVQLGTWGSVRLGTVTGANSFFVLTEGRTRQLGLYREGGVLDFIISARALRGQGSVLTTARLAAASREGVAATLFYPGARLSAAAKSYIEWGESEGVNEGYKCRIRDPWWIVPLVEPAPVLVTYMNAAGVRLVANSSKQPHLNSLHGLYLLRGRAKLARALSVAASSSLSLASAEFVGRSYGGGVLKVEPGEAAKILVPEPELVSARMHALMSLEEVVAHAQRDGDLGRAAEAVDRVLWGRSGAKALDRVREVGAVAAARRRRRGQGA
jgi:hypothetical protein